jgi:hypothetical protein
MMRKALTVGASFCGGIALVPVLMMLMKIIFWGFWGYNPVEITVLLFLGLYVLLGFTPLFLLMRSKPSRNSRLRFFFIVLIEILMFLITIRMAMRSVYLDALSI